MSTFADVLTMLPAAAAIAVIVVALADRRDAAMLDVLRGSDPLSAAPDDELERSAA